TVAVLVLLPRTAGARLVATDLALRTDEGALRLWRWRQRLPGARTAPLLDSAACDTGSARQRLRLLRLLARRKRRAGLCVLRLQSAHEAEPALLLLAIDLLLRTDFDLRQERYRVELHSLQ